MSIFNNLKGLNPKHNAFNLSHYHKTTMRQGYVVPVGWLECIPNDILDISVESLIRCQPLVAPVLNNLTCRIDAFFVPTRLVWDDWKDFITNNVEKSIPPKEFDGTPPVWAQSDDEQIDPIELGPDTLWDYFGLPPEDIFDKNAPAEARPVDFLRRAYYLVWNEWYRDQNIQEPIDFKNDRIQKLLRRAWRKDYFTSAFTSRQKGDPVSIPLTGNVGTNFDKLKVSVRAGNNDAMQTVGDSFTVSNATYYGFVAQPPVSSGENAVLGNNVKNWLSEGNQIDWSKVVTFDVSDMRDMFAIQKFMEHNMMFGTRYIEFLQSLFGCSPSDKTLQRPELLGTVEFDIKISEVLSTVEGELPQGNQTGHGLGISNSKLANYKVEEYGYVIFLANIQPEAVYSQRMPRSLYRKTRFDQIYPQFYNLSYQAIHQRELYGKGNLAEDEKIFAYQGRFDELRESQSYISGDLRTKLFYYSQYREFEEPPVYNSEFIECKPSDEIFAVQDEPPFICWFNWIIKALRPIPELSVPGRIDHVYGE